MLLPVAAALVLFGSDSLHLLAKLGLAGQVILFFGTDALEVLLVALVDDGAGSLETVPDFLTLLLGHRTNLAILLMEFLQLMEGADDIRLVGQLLCGLTEALLLLLILTEVVFAGFAVQTEHIIELLHIELIVTPQFIGLLGRYILDLTPLLLQGFELLIAFVGLLRRGDHRLDLLDNLELLGQVGLFLGFLLLEDLSAFLFDNAHLGLKGFFHFVGSDLVLLRIATAVDVGLETGFALCDMQLVESGLQIVNLFLLGSLVAVGDIPDTLQNLCFGLVDLAGSFHLRSLFLNLLRLWCWFLDVCFYCSGRLLSRCLCGLWGHFFLHHFVVTHFEGILLRVHHLTSLVTDTNYY